MRIAILAKNADRIAYMKGIIQKFGFRYTTTDPTIVISYGGDEYAFRHLLNKK